MFFTWLRDRRREKLLAEPFPGAWFDYLRNVPHYGRLLPDQQQRLRDLLRIFIAEKNWEGCGGLAMTDEIKVTIAALACLLILEKDPESYFRLMSILVYPSSYQAAESQFPRSDPYPLEAREGESWPSGTVVLNWAETIENLREPSGRNLVLHEFAHQLDMQYRYADGTPRLDNREQYEQWQSVMTEEYERLRDDRRNRRPTLLDKYGTKNKAEFFAVATECFFERAKALREQHPDFYRVLAEYYRQDPAGWRD